MIAKKTAFASAPAAQPNIPINARTTARIGIAVASAVKVLINTRIAGQSRQRRIQITRTAIPIAPVLVAIPSKAGLINSEQPQVMKVTEATAISARARMSRMRQTQPRPPPPPGGPVVLLVDVDVDVEVEVEVLVEVEVVDDVVVVDVPGQTLTV